MKKVFIVLASLLVLVGIITLWIWSQPPLIPSLPNRQENFESRISRLEAAVKKLQRETSPRIIPLEKDK
jgi:F0F1-type ATP synthase membrane subunit b/b'